MQGSRKAPRRAVFFCVLCVISGHLSFPPKARSPPFRTEPVMTPWEMIERFCSMTLNISVETAKRYFIFTTLTWLLFYVVLRSRWFHRKIVDRFPALTDIGREVLYSLVSLLMFGVVGTATVL